MSNKWFNLYFNWALLLLTALSLIGAIYFMIVCNADWTAVCLFLSFCLLVNGIEHHMYMKQLWKNGDSGGDRGDVHY